MQVFVKKPRKNVEEWSQQINKVDMTQANFSIFALLLFNVQFNTFKKI